MQIFIQISMGQQHLLVDIMATVPRHTVRYGSEILPILLYYRGAIRLKFNVVGNLKASIASPCKAIVNLGGVGMAEHTSENRLPGRSFQRTRTYGTYSTLYPQYM